MAILFFIGAALVAIAAAHFIRRHRRRRRILARLGVRRQWRGIGGGA